MKMQLIRDLLVGIVFVVANFFIFSIFKEDTLNYILAVSTSGLVYILLLQIIHELKINKLHINHENTINSKFERNISFGELEIVADDFAFNKEKYPLESEKIFNFFREAMAKMKRDVIPQKNREDYINSINDHFSNINPKKTIYLSLLNFNSESWSPCAWKNPSFKRLLEEKRDAVKKGACIITLFIYKHQDPEINEIIDRHLGLGLECYICKNAIGNLTDENCGIFIIVKREKIVNEIKGKKLKDKLRMIKEIKSKDMDSENTIAFIEERIHHLGTFDGKKILNSENIINKLNSFSETALTYCESKS